MQLEVCLFFFFEGTTFSEPASVPNVLDFFFFFSDNFDKQCSQVVGKSRPALAPLPNLCNKSNLLAVRPDERHGNEKLKWGGSPCGVSRNLNAGKNSTNKKKKWEGMLRSHRMLTTTNGGLKRPFSRLAGSETEDVQFLLVFTR